MINFDNPVLLNVLISTTESIIDKKADYDEIFDNTNLVFRGICEDIKTKKTDRYSQIEKLFGYGSSDSENSFALLHALKNEIILFNDKEESELKSLVNKLNDILKAMKDNVCDQFFEFPQVSDLVTYLSYYFELCRFLFENSSLLYEEFNINNKLQTVCEYLTYAPASTNCNIFSPYCSEALLTFYSSVYRLSNECDFSQIDIVLKTMIANSFASIAFRYFRNYVIRDSKVALLSCEYTDYFLEKKSCNLSSYELIKPVRFFSKIKRYVETLSLGSKCKICIIGAVYINEFHNYDNNKSSKDKLKDFSSELYQLINWLSQDSYTKKFIYEFEILINRGSLPESFYNSKELSSTDSFSFHKNSFYTNVNFRYIDYNDIPRRLVDRNDANYLLKDNCLMLILDCPFLYDNIQIISDSSKIENYYRNLPKQYSIDELSLTHCGPIQMIQKQINMVLLNRINETGHFERRIKDRLIRKISENFDKDSESEIFIFISSQNSIDASSYSRKYQVRMERYQSKEFGLLNISNYEDEELPAKNNINESNVIYFNLWNILINTDVLSLEKIRELWNVDSDILIEEYLSNVLVSIKWNNDKRLFENVFLGFKNNNGSNYNSSYVNNSIKVFLFNYFDLLFNNPSNLLKPVLTSMRESFFNIFYSKISCVKHAVAYQKLKEHLSNGKKVIINFYQYQNNIDSDDTKYRISAKKKVYVDVISNLSKQYPSDAKTDVLAIRMKNCNINPLGVYNKLLTICTEYNLENSVLYNNIIKAKESFV